MPLVRGGSKIVIKENFPFGVIPEIFAVHIHMNHQCQRLDLRVFRVFDVCVEQVSEISHEVSAALFRSDSHIFPCRIFILIDAFRDQGNKMKSFLLPDPQQILHRILSEFAFPEFFIVRHDFLGNILLCPYGLDPPRSVDGCCLLPLPAALKLVIPEELTRDPVPVIEEIRHLLHGAEVLPPDPCVEHANRKIRSSDKILVDSHNVVRLKVFLGSVFDRDQRLQKDQEPEPVSQSRPAQEKGGRIHEFFTVF